VRYVIQDTKRLVNALFLGRRAEGTVRTVKRGGRTSGGGRLEGASLGVELRLCGAFPQNTDIRLADCM
jgi:hypothetical protein